MFIVMLNVHAMMARTSCDQKIRCGNRDTTLSRFACQFVRGSPHGWIDVQFGKIALHVPQNPFLMLPTRAIPQFEPDHGAPGGFTGFKKNANALGYCGVSSRSQTVNPCRAIDKRHAVVNLLRAGA